MKRLLITASFLFALLVPAFAQATTYYISPTGSNANNGLTTGTPWLTVPYAMANMAGSPAGCGHTLILTDGAYAQATHGPFTIVKNCTIGSQLLVQAQNQRKALLQGAGSNDVLLINLSAYVIVDGLRVDAADLNSSGSMSNIWVNASNHITIRNSIVQKSNRYHNSTLIYLSSTTASTIEDVELYSFHRYGLKFGVGANSNVARRVYCNSRGYADIAGGSPSGSTAYGDGCITNYPGGLNVIENSISEGNGGGFAVQYDGGGQHNVSFYGDISLNDEIGFSTNSRHATSTLNTIIKDSVVLFPTFSGVNLRGSLNTRVTNVTVYDAVGTGNGFTVDNGGSDPGGGTYSWFCTNCLSTLNTTGFNTSATVQTWTINYPNTFSNTTAFSPATPHANVTNSNTANPTLGTCRVWVPDASPMKGAGLAGADIGANILYRYVDGVLTTVPLWDPTTGEFPHGAVIAGVNDTATTSLYNVHARLNVNMDGCSFPASYSGTNPPTPPENPAAYISSTGITGTAHDHAVDATLDYLFHTVALLDAGGNVGSVATSSSGGEGLTLVARAVSSPAYRACEIWRRAAPTSGTRPQVVTTTGNVTSMVTTSIEIDNISAIGSSATASNISATPSVTVPTNTSETIIDCLSAYSGTSLTAGPNQTLQMDTAHSSTGQRGATSTQSGNDGGVMSHLLGTAFSYWALASVSLLPTTPDAPPSPLPVLNQTKFRWQGVYGAEEVPDVKPYAAAPNNINLTGHPTSMARLRIEITADDNTSTPVGLVLYCRYNADGYTPALDTFGTKVFRLLGQGIFTEIPGSLTTTTQQLSVGNYVAGAMLRSEPAIFNTPSLTTGKHTEMEWVLVFNAAAPGTADCRIHRDDGTAITYTATPRITFAPLAAGY